MNYQLFHRAIRSLVGQRSHNPMDACLELRASPQEFEVQEFNDAGELSRMLSAQECREILTVMREFGYREES